MKGKRHKKGPPAPRPRLLRVDYRDQGGSSSAVFEVPPGVTTRREVETVGTLRYAFVGGCWNPVGAPPPWARSWGSSKQLAKVRHAAPNSVRPLAPAAFVVAAPTWCGWATEARASLRAAAPWEKAPGVMRTGPLDGPTAERVRDLAVQHGLVGLEEIAATEEEPQRRPLVETVDGGEVIDDEPVMVFANPPRFVGGRCEDCGAPAPFPSDLCAACVQKRRAAGEAV